MIVAKFSLFVLLIILQIVKILSLNNRPMIGVLAQEFPEEKGKKLAFIATPYVKFLEMAGARVVPILIKQSHDYYENMVNKTNGLLLPGGGRDLRNSDYTNAAEAMLNHSIKLNHRGDYYPIWSVCQGFQLITILMSKYYHSSKEHKDGFWLTNCNAVDRAYKLNFTIPPLQTRLLASADRKIINILETENVTPNYHHFCMTQENFSNSNLASDFTIISTSRDDNGVEFISTYEHKTLPIYALQWHPEKIPFEFSVHHKNHKDDSPQENIPHFSNSILIAQFMADFFVNEARRNNHSFGDIAEENKVVIYNYVPKFTWKEKENDTEDDEGEHFNQMYEFTFK